MLCSKLTMQIEIESEFPVVQTKQGKLRGLKKNGVFQFRGIPYAVAKRFQTPSEIPSWSGIKDALCYGYASPEFESAITNDAYLCPHYYLPQNENCQYLNIWTKELASSAKKPVLVWIHGDANHGGSWMVGSGVEQAAYDGEELSCFGDVVVVTLNHRLNIAGYLDLSSFGEPYHDSVFAGFGDLIAALRWIRDNIANFGGDWENVTLFGQSGGGDKILTLMQAPAADGLYHKVAISSCNFEQRSAAEGWSEKQTSRRMGELVAEKLGITKDSISEIESVSFNRLYDAARAAQAGLYQESGISYQWGPVANGTFLLNSAPIDVQRPETVMIPMLLGSTFGEGVSNGLPTSSHLKLLQDGRKNCWDLSTVKAHIVTSFKDHADEIIKEFQQAYPGNTLADILFMDDKRRMNMIQLARQRAQIGAKAWLWLFKLESPVYGGITAWHCSEIPYIFHNAAYIESAYIPETSEFLQDYMASAWTAFASSGNPSAKGDDAWQPADTDRTPTILFDKKIDIRVNHDLKLLELMKH